MSSFAEQRSQSLEEGVNHRLGGLRAVRGIAHTASGQQSLDQIHDIGTASYAFSTRAAARQAA
jgi:hypothetical protein